MNKIIWLIIVLLGVGYIVNSSIESNAKREAENAERELIEQKVKASVQGIVTRTNAIKDWESHLGNGESFRFAPILTVELERLWLVENPILFIGNILDIKTHDEVNYIVTVERDMLSSLGIMFTTELQLSLDAPKTQIDTFIKKHPDLLSGLAFEGRIAVIAKVNSIETIYATGEEGVRDEIRVGHGNMIDIEYLGWVQP